MDMKDVLDKLFKEGTLELPSSKRTIVVKKLTLRSLRPVLDLLADVVADLSLGDVSLAGAATLLGSELDGDPSKVLKLISRHYDRCMHVLGFMSDLSLDEVYDLEADDGALFVQAALLVNRDFFIHRVTPALKLMAADQTQGALPSAAQEKPTASTQRA